MRPIAALLAVSLIPAIPLADDRPRPAPASAERADRDARGRADRGGRPERSRGEARPAPAPDRRGPAARPSRERGEARAAPAPVPGSRRYRGSYGYGPRVRYRVYHPYHPFFWLGWGWGWGYYPMYPRPPYPPDEARQEADRIFTRLAFAGGVGENDAAFGGLSLSLDGRHAGFNVAVDAVVLDLERNRGFRDVDLDDDEALGWASAHVTWSVAASPAFRVRAELGVSMLSMPDEGVYAGAPYANTIAFGPDVGVSAQLGLVGPFGIEGHARVTPMPVLVTDTRLALALRGGPFALTAGVRAIDVDGDEDDGPEGRFVGPEIGLSIVF